MKKKRNFERTQDLSKSGKRLIRKIWSATQPYDKALLSIFRFIGYNRSLTN